MENTSRPIALSRSVVLTKESSIPSLLLLGKLASDGSPANSATLLPDRLRHIWGPSGAVNFWRVMDGAFLVQFYEAEDLTKAHEGAPWSCGDGDELFLMQHVKPGMNMVDQIAELTKAELWVRFHDLPVDHFSTTSVYLLAARIGEPVNCDLSHASSAEFLRARIRVDVTRPLRRSVDVTLENGEQASVSVEYEGVPSLCWSCRILGHPPDRCPRRANKSRRESSAVYAPSRLGSRRRRSTSGGTSSSSSSSPSIRRGKSLPVLATTAPAPPALTSVLSPVNGTCFNFWNLKTWRKRAGKNKKSFGTGDHHSQDEIVPSSDQEKNQVPDTNSAQEMIVQEPSIKEAQVAQLDTTRRIMHSHVIVKAQGSRSRKHARIEVVMETHCSPQLIMGAMDWLSNKAQCTGLDAAYDGKRGVISIFGLQIDQNTEPVDLIAYLLPKIRQKTRFAETQTKPDSPARFNDILVRFHDANCCKDASRELGNNGV